MRCRCGCNLGESACNANWCTFCNVVSVATKSKTHSFWRCVTLSHDKKNHKRRLLHRRCLLVVIFLCHFHETFDCHFLLLGQVGQ